MTEQKLDETSSAVSRLLHRKIKLNEKVTLDLNWVGNLYDKHTRFFNDGIVEFVCLLIANIAVWFFSYLGFVQFWLVMMSIMVATPITFILKFLLHKHWVWKKD